VEATNFARDYEKYKAHGVAVLGISTDTVESHKKFAGKLNVPFPLLADTEAKVTRTYDVLKSTIPLIRAARRATFLINEMGKIEKIWDPASAKTQNEDALVYLGETVAH
jgi:thioredoxin-dependent peroxiredoxin